MRSLLFLLTLLGVAALPLSAHAQDTLAAPQAAPPDTAQAGPPPAFEALPEGRPLRGVVWHPPADTAQAVRALRKMKRAGVEAVRTPLIRREAVLRTADSLRLRLFQDLPAAYLAAGELTQALPDLRWELERALLLARRHPSARHFGLLTRSDTSVPATCDMLRELSERVRAHDLEGAVTYYETAFVREDRCAGATGLTLLNALNHERPRALLRRWRQAQTDSIQADSLTSASRSDSVSVGVGAMGQWVDPEAEGLRAPHSPQAQARYFEEHLPPLLGDTARAPQTARATAPAPPARSDSLRKAPAVVFAYRWRDVSTQEGRAALDDPYGRAYGLHDAQGQPRPALAVVRGLYTGRQRVFAFEAGTAPPPRPPWLLLMGWGLVALLGIAYAGASHFRGLARRYFTASNFYRDAVREDRTALGASSFVLLAGVSLCAGLVVTVFLLAVQETGPFVQMLRGASGQTQGWMLLLLHQPWGAVLLVAAFYLVSLAAWAFFLSLATRGRQRLSFPQALALVAWPRWPAFLLAAGAVVAVTLPPGWMLPVSGGLVAAWVLVSVLGMARTLYDLTRLSNVSPASAAALALLNPVLLAAVMAFFAVLEVRAEARFLWHLATRS